jgi:protein tyrosine phosphatase
MISNANWVRELFGGFWWIATQAPLPETSHEFLSLVGGLDPLRPPTSEPGNTYRRVRTVVQLTKEIEDGRRKADAYFPAHVGESLLVPPPDSRRDLPELRVTLLKRETIAAAHCTSSTVAVSPISRGIAQPPSIFNHLLYHAWPDHGVPDPDDRAGLLQFVRLADRINKDASLVNESNTDADPPMMVHCSAGVGRTGAFIALASLLRAYGTLGTHSGARPAQPPPPLPASPLGPLPDDMRDDKVAQEIDSLREQRPGMVQRPEQALLVYEVLHSALSARDNVRAGNGSHR